jgi:hypothetical protein
LPRPLAQGTQQNIFKIGNEASQKKLVTSLSYGNLKGKGTSPLNTLQAAPTITLPIKQIQKKLPTFRASRGTSDSSIQHEQQDQPPAFFNQTSSGLQKGVQGHRRSNTTILMPQ